MKTFKIFFYINRLLCRGMIKAITKIKVLVFSYILALVPADEHEDGYSIIGRSKMVLIAVAIFILLLAARLTFLLTKDIYAHKTSRYNIDAKPFNRLEITDRNGKVLARNIVVYDLYLQASRMENIPADIDKINKIVPNAVADRKKILEKLNKRKENGKVIFIKSGLSIQQKQALVDAGIDGLLFENTEKRFYTSRSANSVVGYCSASDRCISGIEKGMNSYLRTVDNEPLRLSIDGSSQTVMRDILHQKMVETNSQGAAGIIMNIHTGEVISAVSLPDCDFNSYSTCSPSALFNRYSYGVYELGSVFKLILAATALQSGVSPYKKYKREAYQLGNFTIHDIDKKEAKGGELNLIDIIRYSSNVGCAKVMEDIDLKNQFVFIANLGLLKKLNTELPELGKPIYPKSWTFTNGVTISYGHGIAVTPLHFVTAIASLLKNEPVRPTFLATNPKDVERYNYRYLDEENFETFKDIMRQVINSGGGKSAYIDQYDIGGKTGTAIQLRNGRYDRNAMVLSFIAAAPMNNPQYVFYIMLDTPKVDASNSWYIRASMLGKTMGQVISTIGPMLNMKPIGKD